MLVRRPESVVSLGLVALVLIAYSDIAWAGRFEFVNFDDYEYVVENPAVKTGLSAKSFRAALTSLKNDNWIPLTWVSFQLDYQMHGLDPTGYHRTNLVFHGLNVVLLFLFLRRATGALWESAAVAALFAVHPIHVESVAWVTERKDVLSTFFWLLGLLAYVGYARRPTRWRYVGVAGCLILGVMSKPMVVTLPCVLLLLDYWPLRRWHRAPGASATAGDTAQPEAEPIPTRSARQLVIEKLPLLLIVAVSSFLQLQASAELVAQSRQVVNVETRWLNAPVSYVVYLRQAVWPADLAVLYLHPAGGVPPGRALLATAVLVAITVLAVAYRRRNPYLLIGWLWYLGTTVPVLGLVPVARQSHADRFTYIPLIGVFVAVCWGLGGCLRGSRFGRGGAVVLATGVLLACVLVTRAQLHHWRDSVAMWDRAVKVSGDDPRMHFIASGQFFRVGQLDHALRHAEIMRALAPNDPNAERARSGSLLAQNRLDEALEAMSREAALGQDSAELRNAMAKVLWRRGRIPEAYRQLALVAALKPETAEGQHYRGILLQREGKFEEAVAYLERAAKIARNNPRFHCDLALALDDAGNRFAASTEYQLTMELDPNWPGVCVVLARILATHPDAARRDGVEAVRWGRMACSLTGHREPACLVELAAAYAETGQFDRAIETAEAARKIATEAKDSEFVDRLDKAIGSFQKKQPIRSSPTE